MSERQFDVALRDNRPFFESALRHGIAQNLITTEKLQAIAEEAPKGMVQIAKTFGSEYLRPEIELARKRIVNLVSLYLLQSAAGNLDVAAKLIRDNTFLTLSRGGSGLLKALFALPEYAMLGREEKGRVEDFLDVWSLKDKPNDYQNALQQREANALEIEAGCWFGQQLGMSKAALQEADVEAAAVVRSALLIRLFAQHAPKAKTAKPTQAAMRMLNQVEFAQLLSHARDANQTAAKTKKTVKVPSTTIFDDVPATFHPLVERVHAEILKQDLPKITHPALSLDKLVFELKDRYFLRDVELEDTADYDALVAKEWTKITKGKTDVDSLFTLFLSLSVGMPAKTSLSEKSAKSLIKKMRDQGFDANLADQWIRNFAPHEKQESLLEDWHEFIAEAPNYLLDDWDTSYSGALRFLRENCHVEAGAKGG